MEKQYILFYGYHKDKSPMWEAHDHLDAQGQLLDEPSNPEDKRVLKFSSVQEAKEFQDQHYHLEVSSYEVLDMDTAKEIYSDYQTKSA